MTKGVIFTLLSFDLTIVDLKVILIIELTLKQQKRRPTGERRPYIKLI